MLKVTFRQDDESMMDVWEMRQGDKFPDIGHTVKFGTRWTYKVLDVIWENQDNVTVIIDFGTIPSRREQRT